MLADSTREASAGGRARQSKDSPLPIDDDEQRMLDSLLQALPHPLAPASSTDGLHHMPDGNKDSAWRNCLQLVEKHDRDLCQAYREQIDTLLVFAGLFSAVVTAFAIESYQWLLDDPADTSAELLRDIVRLLAQDLNQTMLPSSPSAARLTDGAVARINVLWFLSLTLSLSAALVGILCKQWLREFERDVGQSPEVALAVRYHKFRGLSYWNVGSIVNSVPIVLQVSLALFLIGIVELLWRLHSTVASCVSAVAGLTLLFYMATTILPLMQYIYIILRCWCGDRFDKHYPGIYAFTEPQCAFKSAQAWIAFRVFQPVIEYVIRRYCSTFISSVRPYEPLVVHPAHSWVTFDINWMKRHDCLHYSGKSAYKTLAWVAENLDDPNLSSWIWQCVWGRWIRNSSSLSDVVASTMDIDCVARAYPQPLDIGRHKNPRIRGEISILRCSLRTTIPVDTAVEMLLRIAPAMGVNSRWTCEATKTILLTYRDVTFHLSDDIASSLFQLAKMQTQALVQQPLSDLDSPEICGTEAFYGVFELLLRGARCAERLLPAMCALALQWLRSHDCIRTHRPSDVAFAGAMVKDIVGYYSSRTSGPDECPGIIFSARLARLVAEVCPHFARSHVTTPSYWWGILIRLLEISHADPSHLGEPAAHASNSEAHPTVRRMPLIRVLNGVLLLSAPPSHDSPVHDGEGEPSQPFATTGRIHSPSDAGANVDLNSAASPMDD